MNCTFEFSCSWLAKSVSQTRFRMDSRANYWLSGFWIALAALETVYIFRLTTVLARVSPRRLIKRLRPLIQYGTRDRICLWNSMPPCLEWPFRQIFLVKPAVLRVYSRNIHECRGHAFQMSTLVGMERVCRCSLSNGKFCRFRQVTTHHCASPST